MGPLERIIAARELLENVTPLKGDCGRVCGHACCRADENGKGGMLLFPGEEKLYLGDGDFEIRQDASVIPDGLLITCPGRCRREKRPMGCRFFPLRPTAKGRAVMDRRSAWVCPLYEGGREGLDPAFAAAADEAARILCGDEGQVRFLEALRERILYETEEERLWGRK